MIWLQTLPAFAIWMAYVWVRRRDIATWRDRYSRTPRSVRIVAMLAALFGSLAVLFGGIYGLFALGAFQPDGISLPGIAGVAAVGLVFVHLQMVFGALTLSLAFDGETTAARPTSDFKTTDSNQGDR